MNYNKIVTKAALVMGSSTFISRILGFLRDMVIANYLGTGFRADAFFVAFRIPNFLRRLFGEGSLTASFIPVFTQYYTQQGREEGSRIASISFTLLTITLILITFFGIYFSEEVVKLIAPGFSEDITKFTLTVNLNKIMFSYILFISLVALCMGILNSLKHFFAPAISPALLNISIILGAFFAAFSGQNIVYGVAWGVVGGGILQLSLQIIYLKKFDIKITPNFNFRHNAIKKILNLMGPSILGLGITQINIFIGTLIASFLPSGTVSYLYYADRLIQFPLGIFAVSIGSALLPILSEQQVKTDTQSMIQTMNYSLKLLFLITIPAMIGLIFGGKPILSLLFERGEFDEIALKNVYSALIGYSVALWAYSGIRVVIPLFYAFKNTKLPVKVGFYALIVNILVSLILMKPLFHLGLALATSISSIFNFIILLCFLKTFITFDIRDIFKYILKLTFPSSILIFTLIIYQKIFLFSADYNLIIKSLYIIGMIFISVISYFWSCYITKIEEIKNLTIWIRRKF